MTRVTAEDIIRTARLAGHLSTRAINVTPSSRYAAPLAFAYASVKGSNRVTKPGSVFTRAFLFSLHGETTKLHVEFIKTEKELEKEREREIENQETLRPS